MTECRRGSDLGCLPQFQRIDREMVSVLGVERKKERTEERVEHEAFNWTRFYFVPPTIFLKDCWLSPEGLPERIFVTLISSSRSGQ